MKYITQKTLARNAAKRWKFQYQDHFDNRVISDKTNIYAALVALGSDPDPSKVNAVIGNSSWTAINCDECGKSVGAAVQFGDGSCFCERCISYAKSSFGP